MRLASPQRSAAQLTALSLFLAVFAVVTFYLAIASLRTDLVLAVILWLIFAGLVLLSIGAGASMGNVTKAGGWVVLAFAVLAWYHAAGDVIAATFGRKRMLNPGGPLRSRPRSGCHRPVTDGEAGSWPFAGGWLVRELEQDRGQVITTARAPQVAQVGCGASGAASVQATQVPGHGRAQIELVQQVKRDEPCTEVGFQGPGFLPRRRQGGEENEVHGVQPGPRSLGFEDERDPARLHGQPGLLQCLPPGARGHALAWTWRAPGQDPVIVAVTDPPDQENILAAEDHG